ncbi:MAG TPA: MBL fold metallo-hydrolase [Candidatus Krumholzibacteria bacterium]|nr:MBL fold metallo-hydrolase [Candidatus Krumholzibacteria bacterium]
MFLSFLGAAGTVTGSKYVLRIEDRNYLVDCGLFQGLKNLRQRNWEAPPFDLKSIDAVILTHAHIDHSGYLPVLMKQGYKGPVYCTEATAQLCGILLPDSGHLQEEEAGYLTRHKMARHDPALPLYTRADAEATLKLLKPLPFDTDFDLGGGVRFRFTPAGHILGSAWVTFLKNGFRVVFSGDVGRPVDPIMKAPVPITHADVLICESTYGNRIHPPDNPYNQLGGVIRRTFKRGGTVVVPAFAVGRTQALLHLISELKKQGDIPDMPVYLNSPLGIDATEIYAAHAGEHRLDQAACREMFSVAEFIRSEEASRALNTTGGSAIILAGSGMATGGRVVHHLRTLLPDPRNTVLLAGFQAPGTRGEALQHGAGEVKIFGEYVPVRAEVVELDSMSAHADYVELIDWLKSVKVKPKRMFLTHGEPPAADAFRKHIERHLGWHPEIPEYRDVARLL